MAFPRAVLSGLHYWGSPIRVASHFVARGLVEAGWDAAYLSSPITPLHLLKGMRDNFVERWKSWRSGGATDFEGRLWGYVPLALLGPDNRPFLRNQTVLQAWPHLTLPGLVGKMRSKGFERPDLFYLDNFYHLALARLLQPTKTAYHMADVYSSFPGYSPAFGRAERDLVASASVVFYPSLAMESYVRSMSPRRMVFLPNGLDFELFAGVDSPEPPEYMGIPAPRAVYAGAMDVWFDFALLERAARENPHVSFVLIGPDFLARKRLPPLPNIHILGPRQHNFLPGYLRHAQVGLIPFDVAAYPDLIHPVRPLKLLEYLAAGLPCVSVGWRELETMDSPAVLCLDEERFSRAVGEAAEGKRPDPKTCQDYARQYDWGRIMKGFFKGIE